MLVVTIIIFFFFFYKKLHIVFFTAKLYGFVNMEKCDEFKAPQRTITREQKQNSRKWIYYIAAEEIVWNYAPNEPPYVDQ